MPENQPVRTYVCDRIGDGTELDPYRPEILAVGGIQRWEMLDDDMGGLPNGRMLIRVYASLTTHNQISTQTGAEQVV